MPTMATLLSLALVLSLTSLTQATDTTEHWRNILTRLLPDDYKEQTLESLELLDVFLKARSESSKINYSNMDLESSLNTAAEKA